MGVENEIVPMQDEIRSWTTDEAEVQAATADQLSNSVAIGTVLGAPSLAELRQLCISKDAEVSQIDAIAVAFRPQWTARDPNAAAAFYKDWDALKNRYAVARANAQAALNSARWVLLSDSSIPAQDRWDELLASLQKKEGVVSPGDLQDLYDKLDAAITAAGLKHAKLSVPQPQGGDLDMDVYRAAEAARKATVEAARKAVESGKEALTPSWTTIALMSVGVLALLAASAYVLRGAMPWLLPGHYQR